MSRQPELPGLFCGSGGASAGYRQAGFAVTGVDNAPATELSLPLYPGGSCSVAAARDAMGIDWMTKRDLNQAIPPA
ncbi:MAG: hypothetical protein GDA53_11845 [Rhodobacteraceae bacterium]|nr:hypothetical protein [Paracoccaceae bacterium]